MKYIPNEYSQGHDLLVLSRRNLEALLEKLDDPLSQRILMRNSEDGQRQIWVKAEEDDEHYGERQPGPVYMPTSGETR